MPALPPMQTPQSRPTPRAVFVTAVAVVFASLGHVRGLTLWFRERGLLTTAVLVAFVLGLLLLAALLPPVRWAQRSTGQRARLLVLVTAAAAVALALLQHTATVEEKLHVVEYGLLTLLAARALPPSPGIPWQPALLVAFTGAVDELVQAALPNRHFDLWDILLNAGSAACVALLLVALRPAAPRG